jgi:DNA-binding transcriptional LysR family regulator
MTGELDLRLLRHFVAVAEELHFTRAAARLYLAQQALSRDVARLERQLGVRLFTRTTRRVALTPEGERLLQRARELLALHDQAVQELHGPDEGRPLLVDLLAEGHTPTRVLHAARRHAPHAEVVARFHGGSAPHSSCCSQDASTSRSGEAKGSASRSPPPSWSAAWSGWSRWRCCSRPSTRSPPSTRSRWPRWPAPGWTRAPATSWRRSGPTWESAC